MALLWALHPLQTETVVYVTQRTELMVGFFYLATLYSSLLYWNATASAGRKTWLALAILSSLAGMACKEVMVTAPVVVLLFERTFISGSFRRALKQSWPLYAGLFLSWGLLAYLNYDAPRSDTAGFHLGVPAYSWWLTQTKVLLMYLKLVVWPWPLSSHHQMPYLTTLVVAWPWLVTVALLSIVTLLLLWRHDAIGFVGASVFLILSPTFLVPIITEVAAERRMYLPLAALIALLVVGGYWLVQQTAKRLAPAVSGREHSPARWPTVLTAAIAVALAAALSVVSFQRLAAYQDEVTFWQDVLALQPDDSFAHNNLGMVFGQRGRVEDAKREFDEALRLNPDSAMAHYNLGCIFRLNDKIPEAIAQYELALRMQPKLFEAHHSLGEALLHIERPREAADQLREALQRRPDSVLDRYELGLALFALDRTSEAISEFDKAVRLKPDFAEARSNLGFALALTGQLPEAIEQLEEVLRLKPDLAPAHRNLGFALAKAGRPEEAIAQYRQAIELDPNQCDDHYKLGNLLLGAGKFSEAIEQLHRALELNPDYAEAESKLAVALLNTEHPQEALEHCKKALQLRPNDTEACANMALAYDQMHQPSQAIATGEKALDMARSQGQTEEAKQIEAWLKSYRAQQSETASP